MVNAASRLEGTNKVFGTRLLVSRTVLDQTPPAPEWTARPVARVQVVGRDGDLDLWEVSATPPPWADTWADLYQALASGASDALSRLVAYAAATRPTALPPDYSPRLANLAPAFISACRQNNQRSRSHLSAFNGVFRTNRS
ncbi:hypothetical protein [Elstera litoralis]|uniref:hypothetical protein n=1 Tax=Elstera litoralis TaxID=552518 RepID=UPI0012EE0DA3|nr:hypothetical protein [Elstera litoralis]